MKPKSYFEKILVPVDGSHTCLHAEELAANMAKKFDSKITVVHVVSHDFMPSRMIDYRVSPSVITEMTNWFLQSGKKILAEAEALFKEEGLDVEARIVQYEDPAETILRIAKEGDYGLITMGNRGETEAEIFSLGSVAEKVSRHAECPVLLVKQKTRLSKILVAIDGSESAEKAVEYAAQLAREYQAKVTLLNVQESKLFGFKPDLVRDVGEQILSEATAKLEGTEMDTQLEFGNPAEIIIEVANKDNYDLIVVGSRGLSGVKRFFLGSVSDNISHHAECSVLVVR